MNNLFLFMSSNSKNLGYVKHQLNDSQAKASYSFTKQTRFYTPGRRISTEALYFPPVQLHTTKSISFGYGKKSPIIGNTLAPSPDKYTIKREFDTVEIEKGITFGNGREVTRFGDMFGGTRRKLPGVGAYNIDKEGMGKTNGGYIGAKLESCFNQKHNQGPGPGKYDVSGVDLGNSGSYVLSKFKNPQHSNYRFKTEHSGTQQIKKQNSSKKPKIGPGSYRDIDCFNPEGVYKISQHTSSKGWTFGRSRRRSLVEDFDKTPGPGLYQKFSIFGETEND